MTDPTFDPRLVDRLRRYGDRGLDPFDPLEIAETAIADRQARARRPDLRLLAVAAVLIVAGGLAAALAVGSRPSPGGSEAIVFAYSTGGTDAPRTARRVDIVTETATELVRERANVSVAPDGRHVAFQDAPDVHLVDTGTGAAVAFTGLAPGPLHSPSTEGTWHDFVWSPGGRWVSWMSCATDGCLGTIEATDGSGAHWIPRAGPDPAAIALDWNWSDDDHLLVFQPGQHLFSHTSLAKGDGSDARPCTSPSDCHVTAPTWGMVGSDVITTPLGTTVSWDGGTVAGISATPDNATGVAIVVPASSDPQTRPTTADSGCSGRTGRRWRWTSGHTSPA